MNIFCRKTKFLLTGAEHHQFFAQLCLTLLHYFFKCKVKFSTQLTLFVHVLPKHLSFRVIVKALLATVK